METDAATSAQPTVLDGPVATASDPAGDRVPGRFCPHDYALEHDLFAAPAKYRCNCLYVVGGLYGNIPAAKALDELLQNEPEQNRLLVLNGDLHWFDARTADFLAIERLSKQHVALLGNVEAELRRSEDSGAGCGCAYPYELAAEETVERSNAIHQQLKALMEQPGMQTLKDELDERPSVALVEVGGRRVAITHGDERYLAGWQCAREALRSPARQQQLANWAD
ncbi:MAG: hypothetical protein LBP28_07060, partial [Coriobacteriales bacterium]|nr:hypothetical protein [Coriobacteriales bacterium]